MPNLQIGLKIQAQPPEDQSLENGLTLVHWLDGQDVHHVYVQAEGFDESGMGAQAVAELLRDTAEGILKELGVEAPPSGFTLGQSAAEPGVGKPPVQAKPDVRTYKTPERVQKAREDRAQRRHERKFRPHA